MKLSTTKNQILNAVLLAERIAGKKESLPVLSCILIDAGKELILRATNLEAGIEIKVPGDIEEKGVIAVPAGIFSQTLRSIGSEKLTLRSDEGNLIVESKGTRTLIKAIPHTEFPTLPSSTGKKGLKLPREKLLQALQSIVYAASPSMIRPELGSIFVSVKTQGITCVATDSFRLAEKKIPASSSKTEVDILIPLKHAAELSYILERTDEEAVEVVAEDTQMIATLGNVQYISRVIDGQFPHYKDIIPKAVSGEDVDINFHIGYLSECLSSIQSDSITLTFAGIGRPLVIKGVSDASFLYLVRPLNR